MVKPLTEMAKDLTLALIENNLIAPEDIQQHLQQIHAFMPAYANSKHGFVASFAQRMLEGEFPPIAGVITPPVCRTARPL
jgi:hypothetical protein